MLNKCELIKSLAHAENSCGPNQLVEIFVNGANAGSGSATTVSEDIAWTQFILSYGFEEVDPWIDLNIGSDVIFSSAQKVFYYNHDADTKITEINDIVCKVSTIKRPRVIRSKLPD